MDTNADTLTIGQVAERTGFSASSLRYYEGIGLVTPVGRTDAGYRLYDDGTLDRLAFIARAKQLGCTLEEITDLVSIWDGEQCGPVQRRLHDLVTAKIRETQGRLAELDRFAGQLRLAATQLSGEPVDGPCGDDCACLAPPSTGVGESVALGTGPSPAADPPIACTLSADDLGERRRDWDALLTHVSARTRTADGALRLHFDATTPLDELARLVVAEQRCCAFFSFTLSLKPGATTLEVRAPADGEAVLTDLFGPAA